MASNYLPSAGNNVVVDGYNVVKKMPLPTTARSFPSGAPLWNNGASGVEPSLQQTGDDTSVDHANSVFAPLFTGFAGEARVPQQNASVAAFSAPGNVTLYPDDASRPFLSVLDSGIAIGPCAALGAQHEIGEYVQLAGFQNESTTGFYAPNGTLVQDPRYYLYMNQVQIAVTQNISNSIGKLVERALAGQTFLKFEFNAPQTNV